MCRLACKCDLQPCSWPCLVRAYVAVLSDVDARRSLSSFGLAPRAMHQAMMAHASSNRHVAVGPAIVSSASRADPILASELIC